MAHQVIAEGALLRPEFSPCEKGTRGVYHQLKVSVDEGLSKQNETGVSI